MLRHFFIFLITFSLINAQKLKNVDDVDKFLLKIANTVNKTMPMMIDSDTRAETTYILPGKNIHYVYTMINYSVNDLTSGDIEDIKNTLLKQQRNLFKSMPEMKFFRDNDVTINYMYKDKNGYFVFDFSFIAGQ